MERAQLSVNLRAGHGKGVARKSRAAGKIPGIIYGKKIGNIPIEVIPKDMNKIFSGQSQMNTLLDLEIPQHGKILALLKDYQADNITRAFTHVDFMEVDITQKISVAIPIQITGKAEGVKEGGILEQIRREIEVICIPTAIPPFIEVDVTPLKIGQSFHLSDLKFPEGVEPPHEGNFTIISIVAPKAEEVITPTVAAEGAPAEPEVLTAKKTEGAEEKKTEGKAEKKEGKAEKK